MAKDTSNETDEFCWQLEDGINDIFENKVKFNVSSNLSEKEKWAFHTLVTEKKTKSTS